ncbi:aminotransferase class I/II-fold pyridoxal phosphate-dependent enzyme [Natronorubrum sp. JWXQ-INN-674]|uniref:Aminotransferase class I/II-fold pyridoxal phosphate-dependent enzyme n=1 Tax=Natronorubrum halalkaliphilum TaxID=2691917 RepID=A0A6B0VTJ9_9EURY|nr:DegT/DnrJ/EryC1/StrS family aminotransferase [Natronorubrum halalkaliphilum]MXV63859.1 aminotransferase class I/II-fold pyridoxal phosphate-dependent enzyme [Natronorubrum halalkaliphilum]
MSNEIPLFEIPWDEADVSNAVDSITRGSYWANGPYIEEFEDGLESYLGVDHAITVNSGTTALVAALTAHGIGEGDEVIVPSFTFIATANAVRLVGARPVFADIERETYGLDPEHAETMVTDDTAAILPIHPYGAACEIDRLEEIAADADVPLIEDVAEAFGADYRGRTLGSIGGSATLSFCQNKVLPTGEGGAVVTDDDDVARRLEQFRSHGRASSDYFDSADSGEYVGLGTNVRMSDLVASIGCAQLEKVDAHIANRRRAASRLSEAFSSMNGIEPHTAAGRGRHVYQLYTVTLGETVDRDVVIDTLDQRGIASKVYWDPAVHLTDPYREAYGYEPGLLPVTEDVTDRVLSLPIHPNLSESEIDRITAGIRAGIERSRATNAVDSNRVSN